MTRDPGPPPSTAPKDQIPSGALVRLLSGGPVMTVQHHHYRGSEEVVTCTWFDGSTRHEEDFRPSTVRLSPTEPMLAEVGRQVWEKAQRLAVFEARCDAVKRFVEDHPNEDPAYVLGKVQLILGGGKP